MENLTNDNRRKAHLLNSRILSNSYPVQQLKVNDRGVVWEMRRKSKGATPFLVVYSPTTDPAESTFEFYFPTRQLSAEEILKQFENL